jgi:hypothetical protein
MAYGKHDRMDRVAMSKEMRHSNSTIGAAGCLALRFDPKNHACVLITSLSMVDNAGTLQVVCCLGRAHLVNESIQPADSVERSIRCIGLSVHSKSLEKKHAFVSDTRLLRIKCAQEYANMIFQSDYRATTYPGTAFLDGARILTKAKLLPRAQVVVQNQNLLALPKICKVKKQS